MSFVGPICAPFIQLANVAYAVKRSAILRAASRCNNLSIARSHMGVQSHSIRHHSSSTPQSALHGLRERSRDESVLVFQSTSDNPYHNLSIEHFLLTNSDVNSRILFFYTNRPCVVIGRNQNPWTECNLTLIQGGIDGTSIDLVRRRSGGGTVFHDEGNLNFSVIVPNDKDFTRRKHSEVVVRALNHMPMISAEYDGPENIWVNDRHDITMLTMHNKAKSEFKVSGSAYKLTRGRALHHGTLLHSSPNLDSISKLLRSPGRDSIRAKGVESVRRPVMNLFNVNSSQQRDIVRAQVTAEIAKEFLKVYGSNERITLVGDQDCLHATNPEIAKGVDELLTNEWRFEQTPGFEYFSRLSAGRQITFSVKNGAIQDARIGGKEDPMHQRQQLQLQRQSKIYEIQDWSEVFNPESVNVEQMAALAQAFPNLQGFLSTNRSSDTVNGSAIEQGRKGVVRHFKDGTVEKELGSNTVEEIKS